MEATYTAPELALHLRELDLQVWLATLDCLNMFSSQWLLYLPDVRHTMFVMGQTAFEQGERAGLTLTWRQPGELVYAGA